VRHHPRVLGGVALDVAGLRVGAQAGDEPAVGAARLKPAGCGVEEALPALRPLRERREVGVVAELLRKLGDRRIGTPSP
jgi:hypothetical protein